MAVVRNVAVVSESKSVKVADLVAPVAAMQIQITRDFAPVWRRPATIAVFDKLTSVPVDHWPVIVRDDIPYDAQGIHLDRDGSPFALVLYSPDWSLTTSHEVLEMLGDPLGTRTRTAPSIKAGQGQVKYLVEVCDPSEASDFAYDINGSTVSDFYLPSFFDAQKVDGRRYSFTNSIKSPRTILKGGYISWQVPSTREWWQQTYFGTKKFRNLGVFSQGTNPRRGTDGMTDVPASFMQSAPSTARALAAANGAPKERADFLRAEVRRIVAAATP